MKPNAGGKTSEAIPLQIIFIASQDQTPNYFIFVKGDPSAPRKLVDEGS
jgi:hypothetical protein